VASTPYHPLNPLPNQIKCFVAINCECNPIPYKS